MIQLKTATEISRMRRGGKILASILKLLVKEVRMGTRASDLDRLAEELILKQGGEPAFKHYQGFPATLCVSINFEVVHGLPKREKILKNGDVVGLDLGIKYDSLYTDSAITAIVGQASEEAQDLVKTCKESLWLAIKNVKPGKRIGDISYLIQKYVEDRGYSVVRELVGHGIGHAVHEDPRVPNYGYPGEGFVLKPGMVFCIEPMINMGESRIELGLDGKVYQTVDKSLSAHFEHTIAITESGYIVLTKQ